MYIISGADGKEYGPASLEQIRQWIAEGRINSQTRVREDSGGEWKTAAEFPELGLAPVARIAGGGAPPLNSTPGSAHALTTFPVAALILLHYVTCGIFSLIWLNLMHGKLPRVRPDDPSAGRAIGFCFIPFFNFYWIFFTYRRLCLRLDEQRDLYGLAPSNLRGLATAACIFQVIPYLNALIGYTILVPVFIGLMQSSVNQLVTTSATTPPRATLPTLAAAPGMSGGAIAGLVCACLLVPILILTGMLLPALTRAKGRAQRINCVNNLKQIGLAFRTWELDNNEQFPFNVSTNKGGTLELCLPGEDGFDQNSWLHFQVMSNELSTPKILLCPADATKQAASDFDHLHALNVTYQVHSGAEVSDANPQLILALCPVHRNVLLSDGSVQMVSEATFRKLLHP
jgi:hypothetical protein